MLQLQKRNLSQKTPIQQCINQIEQAKTQIKSKVSQYFQQYKKKLALSLQKTQKVFHAKINQACISSIDVLIKLNQTSLHFLQVQKYLHKTNKLVCALRGLDIDSELKNFTGQIKTNIQQVKKLKVLQQLPKINQQDQLMKLQRVIKVQGQPLQKITIVNKKLVQIRNNSVSIQKNTINKQFDLILPIKIQNKQKQIIFALHDNTIGIYNDKLIMNCFKKFQYTKGQIIGAAQIKNYIIIAQLYKISRININNLNQIIVRVFKQQIIALGNSLHNTMLQIGTQQKIIMLNFDTLQPLIFITVQNRIKKIISAKDSSFLIVTFNDGLKVYRNLQLLQTNIQTRTLKIAEAYNLNDKLIVVTNQLHLYYMNLLGDQNGMIETQRINQGVTKIVKSAAFQGYEIYCLSENGNKIYVYSF